MTLVSTTSPRYTEMEKHNSTLELDSIEKLFIKTAIVLWSELFRRMKKLHEQLEMKKFLISFQLKDLWGLLKTLNMRIKLYTSTEIWLKPSKSTTCGLRFSPKNYTPSQKTSFKKKVLWWKQPRYLDYGCFHRNSM